MDLRELNINDGEFRHPWETSRGDFFTRVVSRHLKKGAPINALDIGSGDAWLASLVLKELPSNSRMCCVDASYSPALVQKLRARCRGRIEIDVPENERFDLILLLDVIEHVKDDQSFLKKLVAQNADVGGTFVISVPAYQALFSAHDEWLEHHRRYSPRHGRTLVQSCGLEVVEEGGLFHGLLYVRMLQKLKEQVIGADKSFGVGRWQGGPTITRFASEILNLDWKFTEVLRALGVQLPGLSWWCVCRKI